MLSRGSPPLLQTFVAGPLLQTLVADLCAEYCSLQGACRGGVCRRTPPSVTNLCRERAAQACYKANVFDSLPIRGLLRGAVHQRGLIVKLLVDRSDLACRRLRACCFRHTHTHLHTFKGSRHDVETHTTWEFALEDLGRAEAAGCWTAYRGGACNFWYRFPASHLLVEPWYRGCCKLLLARLAL